MSILDTINALIEEYSDEEESIRDGYSLDEKIHEVLRESNVDWDSTQNYVDCSPGYEQTFFVYSWIENNELNMIEFLYECC